MTPTAESNKGLAEDITIAPCYRGILTKRDRRSWPRTRALRITEMLACCWTTPPFADLPGSQSRCHHALLAVDLPFSPLAPLCGRDSHLPCGSALVDSISEAVPSFPSNAEMHELPLPFRCNCLFGSCCWIIYSNSAKCFGISRRAQC